MVDLNIILHGLTNFDKIMDVMVAVRCFTIVNDLMPPQFSTVLQIMSPSRRKSALTVGLYAIMSYLGDTILLPKRGTRSVIVCIYLHRF